MKKILQLIKRNPVLSIVILVYTAGMISVSVPKSMELTEDSDFYAIFWNSGKEFTEKQELYYRTDKRPFLHPPFAAFVFQAFHILPFHTSALVWFLMNALIIFPAAIYLIYRMLKLMELDSKKIRFALVLGAVFSLQYFWSNLVFFNINYILFLVLLIGFYYMLVSRPRHSGILFTVIALIKIIPAVFAAYVFLNNLSRKVVISMILTALLCLTIPATIRGFDRWVLDHKEHYENVLKGYISEGRIVCDPSNHTLKAGLMKTFHPETRNNSYVFPEDYPVTSTIASILQFGLLGLLVLNGIKLYRRKTLFSIAYMSSIQLYIHLFSGLTWSAHLVTMIFCYLPVLLINREQLSSAGKILYFLALSFMFFLGIEGSDTTGLALYHFIRLNGIYPLFLLSLFIFCSWVVWDKRSSRLYPETVLI